MDILTVKGQETLKQEQEMMNFISMVKNISYIPTPKHMPAKVDGLIIRNNVLDAVYECKCRNMSRKQLKDFGSWLVTAQKIKDGIEVSKALCIPFLGFLYLIPDHIVLFWKITNSKGDLMFNIKQEMTMTQACVNGGQAKRMNAFLPYEHSKFLGIIK